MQALGFLRVAVMGAVVLLAGCASTSAARSEPTPDAATAPAGK
jgi:outer membrane murein-binding lipoprotein Lpp